MAESELEKMISRLRKILCDWGIPWPTTPKNGEFYGNTAPMWKCPSPRLLLISGLFNILIFIIMLVISAYTEKFAGNCSQNLALFINFSLFLFGVNGSYQFYMSRSDIATDKQWCRYITLSIAFESLLLLFSLGLLFEAVSSCQTQDSNTYGIAMALAFIGMISAGVFAAIIAFTIVRLYCIGNPIAYNEDYKN